jgi:BASS family bile acid:Na+ symporter
MSLLNRAATALGWLGHQGTRVVAVSIFVGIAVPPLAAWFKPMFAGAIFVLLCLAFLRVDPGAVRAHIVRPALVLAATAWLMLAMPTLFGLGLMGLGVDAGAHGLVVALVLQASAPPMSATPAIAALMGLEPALVLAVLLACTVVTPVTTPVFAGAFLGTSMTVSPISLGVKLALMLGGAALIATLIRRLAGEVWVRRQKGRIDGLNVMTLFVFAVALMDGVLARLRTEPFLVGSVMGLSFVVALGMAALTGLLFARAGGARAFALALAGGSRNMGLLLAAAGGAVPDLTWLYIALAQIPFYVLPQVLKPLARRLAHEPCPTTERW